MNQSKPFRIGMLLGGSLGVSVLKELIDFFEIAFILTDRGSPEVPELAKQLNFTLFVGNPREGNALEFISSLNQKHVDVLVSANYRFLISEDLISYPRLFAINIHGSLLPRYRGRAPLIWAIINGEKESGITIHCIDDGCDTGDILLQKRINIPSDATGGEMVDVFSTMYPSLIKKTLDDIKNGTYVRSVQDESEVTYYGRRTPEDGLICWDWHKERIYNWVRALAYPYPGAFTLFEKNKIIINSVCFSTKGFSSSDPNGLVLAIESNNPVIKTPNGALILNDFVCEGQMQICVGDLLGEK